jgi:hypothetical protein
MTWTYLNIAALGRWHGIFYSGEIPSDNTMSEDDTSLQPPWTPKPCCGAQKLRNPLQSIHFCATQPEHFHHARDYVTRSKGTGPTDFENRTFEAF